MIKCSTANLCYCFIENIFFIALCSKCFYIFHFYIGFCLGRGGRDERGGAKFRGIANQSIGGGRRGEGGAKERGS